MALTNNFSNTTIDFYKSFTKKNEDLVQFKNKKLIQF